MIMLLPIVIRRAERICHTDVIGSAVLMELMLHGRASLSVMRFEEIILPILCKIIKTSQHGMLIHTWSPIVWRRGSSKHSEILHCQIRGVFKGMSGGEEVAAFISRLRQLKEQLKTFNEILTVRFTRDFSEIQTERYMDSLFKNSLLHSK